MCFGSWGLLRVRVVSGGSDTTNESYPLVVFDVAGCGVLRKLEGLDHRGLKVNCNQYESNFCKPMR